MELASLYTVPLSAVDGLSRLTKLTTSKAAGTADSNSNRISNIRRSLICVSGVFFLARLGCGEFAVGKIDESHFTLRMA